MASSRRFVRIIVALSSLTLALLLTQSLLATEAPSPNARLLHPGDNLIGWVDYQTTSQDLFEQIPQAELIYTWDTEQHQFRFAARGNEAGLHALKPGMGLIVRIAGADPVEWHQPTVANGERLALGPGPNLVAWTGPSETPLDLAVRSIGDTFEKAQLWNSESGEYEDYNAGARPTSEPMPRLRRGDALWIFNKTYSSWLQPSGDRPLHPLGPPPDHVRWYASFDKYLDADGIAIIATENVADEALFRAAAIFDEMLINRPDIRDTLVRSRVHIVVLGESESVFDLTPYRQYRGRIELEPFGAAGPRGIGPNNLTPTLVPEESLLCLDSDRYRGYDVAVHEFAHAIDYAISSSFQSGNFRSALFSAYRDGREAGIWQGTHAMRNSAEFWATGVQAWLGLVGETIHPPISNHIDLMHYAPSLAKLVLDTLGEIQLDASCQQSDARRHGAVRKYLINGSVVDVNGDAPLDARFYLRWKAPRTVVVRSYARSDGTFNAFAAPGDYSLQVTIEGCTVYFADSEPTIKQSSAGTLSVADQDLDLEIHLPEGVCEHRVTGRLADATGQPALVSYLVADGAEASSRQNVRSDGSFSLRLPDHGLYRLRVSYRGCHYVFNGSTVVRGPWLQNTFDAKQLAANELDLRLPRGACAGKISGILLNHRGDPATGSFVGIYSPWYTSNPQVQADGAFDLPVDLPGEHILMISAPFCNVFYGDNGFSTDVSNVTPFQMTTGDIKDLEIKIPQNVCDS